MAKKLRKPRVKFENLNWKRVGFCDGGPWWTQEWECVEYPDLFTRVHGKKGSKAQFHQVFLRGSNIRYANLLQAFRALLKRKAIRIGPKTKPRRRLNRSRSKRS